MAIFTTRKPILCASASHHCACVVKWLSVVSLLLLLAGSSFAQTGVNYIETVPDGELYLWKYRMVPPAAAPTGTSFTISGLHDVQAVVVFPPADWIATYTSTTATYTWVGAGNLDPTYDYPAPDVGYFGYTSSSATGQPADWTFSNGMGSGQVDGAAEPPQTASVTVYDNYLNFGSFVPTAGSSDIPAAVIASESTAGVWGPTSGIPAVSDYDVAYVQIETPRRLNISVQADGHLKRCSSTGQAFAGVDGRKQTPGPYELATQWKVAFMGRFLTPAGVQYASPTSGQLTDYDTWTAWSPSGNDPSSDDGWLWPSVTDAWTGEATTGYTPLPSLDLLVERSQYTGSSIGGPAGICLIERVLRRGQQDVEGNYKQVIEIHLTYAE